MFFVILIQHLTCISFYKKVQKPEKRKDIFIKKGLPPVSYLFVAHEICRNRNYEIKA